MKNNRFNKYFKNYRLSDKCSNLIFTIIIFLLATLFEKLI